MAEDIVALMHITNCVFICISVTRKRWD